MDGAVGAVHVDATEQAHQQAADQCRDHVGHHPADHQRHHHGQAEQGVRRLAQGRRHLVDLRRQAEHQEIAVASLQLADRLPGADHQQGIAQAQLLFQHAVGERFVVATQADHVEPVLRTEAQFQDALAEQGGVRRQSHLGHADLPRLVDEVAGAERQAHQVQLGAAPVHVLRRGEDVQQQHVARLQLGAAADLDHLAVELAYPLQADHVGAQAGAQLQFFQGAADQRRAELDLQAPLAAGQAIVADQVAQGPPCLRRADFRRAGGVQPVAREQHVGHADGEHHQAYRGEGEEAEAGMTLARQLAVDHHVRWRGDQGHHAADQSGEGQRHHQPARRDLQLGGDAQDHRDEDRHHPGGTHHRAQPGHRQHQQYQQARFAAAGAGDQPVADLVGHPGTHQAFADHEQRGDQYHAGIAEAGQGFVEGKGSADAEGHDHQQGDHVQAQAVVDEEDDGGGEQADHPEQFEVHAGI